MKYSFPSVSRPAHAQTCLFLLPYFIVRRAMCIDISIYTSFQFRISLIPLVSSVLFTPPPADVLFNYRLALLWKRGKFRISIGQENKLHWPRSLHPLFASLLARFIPIDPYANSIDRWFIAVPLFIPTFSLSLSLWSENRQLTSSEILFEEERGKKKRKKTNIRETIFIRSRERRKVLIEIISSGISGGVKARINWLKKIEAWLKVLFYYC